MTEPIVAWARNAGIAPQPIETLIEALRASEPGRFTWLTLGGAIDETSTVGQFLARWWTGPHPAHSIARVIAMPETMLPRVPRLFTRPLVIQVMRGEQVYRLVVQDD